MTSQPAKSATPEQHSNIVGGSSAGRRIACPGSMKLENSIPKAADEESSYAAEGTAYHEVMAHVLNEGVAKDDLHDELVGDEFYGYVMTSEMVDEAIVPAVDFFDTLCDKLEEQDGGDFEFEIEKSVRMPGIPGAFGTGDIIGRTPKRSVIVDWKFGAGVPVFAYDKVPYTDEAGAASKKVGNKQLMFYARAAMHTFPDLFEEDPDWPVELFICQPRIDEAVGDKYSRHTVTVKELEAFRMELVNAVAEAQSDNPRLAPKEGPYCRWCSARPICPTHTGPQLDLTKMEQAQVMEPEHTDTLDDDEYCAMLADVMTKGEIIEEMVKEAKKQAMELLEAGFEIPGWGLKPKRKGHDKWVDEDAADKHLGNLGLSAAERRVIKPITPAAARKALKKIDKKLKDKYVDFGKSSGYTLDRLENIENPVVFPRQSEVQEKLEQLSEQED